MIRPAFVSTILVLTLAGCGSSTTPVPATTRSAPAQSASAAQAATPSAAAFDLSKVEDSVAYIQTQGTFVTADGTKEQVYTGSGFVIDSTGLVVTNNHVVTGGAFWKVQIGTDKTLYDAQLLGVSECSDLAVLKVAGTFPALTMSPATPAVGEPIYVAGHPNGDPYTLTNGIVAKPPYQADTSWASVKQEIQITAQTYPGNSGGPVVDAAGQVIGIEYAGGTPGSAIAGESFAITSSEAMPVIQQLEAGRNLEYLGINGEANSTNTGISIVSVAPGSPADKAGILPGDLMTNLNGTAVGADGTKATYCSVLRSHSADAVLSVTVQRGDQTLTGEINGRALTPLNGGSSGTGSSGTGSGGTGSGGSTTGAIDKLTSFVPAAVWPNCAPSTNLPYKTIVESATCQPVTGVTRVWYDLYGSAADLKDAYTQDVQSIGAPTAGGKKCTSSDLDTTWSITFPNNKVLGGPDFRLLCYTDTKGAAWIEQEDPSTNIMYTVELQGGKLADLYTWWFKNDTVIDTAP